MTGNSPHRAATGTRSRTRAKSAAANIPGATAGELAGLYYHRRLLARVFHTDPARWVLKGGQALLARWPAARYSTDIDPLGDQDSTDEAVAALIDAAAVVGTWVPDVRRWR